MPTASAAWRPGQGPQMASVPRHHVNLRSVPFTSVPDDVERDRSTIGRPGGMGSPRVLRREIGQPSQVRATFIDGVDLDCVSTGKVENDRAGLTCRDSTAQQERGCAEGQCVLHVHYRRITSDMSPAYEPANPISRRIPM